MSYHDVDGVEIWVSERARSIPNTMDPYKHAAEKLAVAVEEYLYAENLPGGAANPRYGNPDFLAWSLARYDAAKTGSGHVWNHEEWTPETPTHSPIPRKKGNYEGRIIPEKPPAKKRKKKES